MKAEPCWPNIEFMRRLFLLYLIAAAMLGAAVLVSVVAWFQPVLMGLVAQQLVFFVVLRAQWISVGRPSLKQVLSRVGRKLKRKILSIAQTMSRCFTALHENFTQGVGRVHE